MNEKVNIIPSTSSSRSEESMLWSVSEFNFVLSGAVLGGVSIVAVDPRDLEALDLGVVLTIRLRSCSLIL